MDIKHTASSLAKLQAAQARREANEKASVSRPKTAPKTTPRRALQTRPQSIEASTSRATISQTRTPLQASTPPPPRKPILQPHPPSLQDSREPKTVPNPTKVPTRTYRVGRIPNNYTSNTLTEALRVALNLETSNDLKIRSLSTGYLKDEKGEPFLSATLECKDILIYIKSALSNIGDAKLQPSSRPDEWQVEICHPDLGHSVHVFLDSHFIGFTPLSPIGGIFVVDCVAIHGWGSHAFGAYKAPNQNFMWLRDQLPKDIPSLRIWSYGYDFGLQTEESFAGIDEHAENFRLLLEVMRRVTQSTEQTPLIFIAHSLGGIILKQAFIEMRASTNSREQVTLDCTTGITFFGVPSQGMKIQALAAMIGDRPQRYDLNRLDQDVGYRLRDKQHRDFCKAFDYRDAKVIQFFETKQTPDVKEEPITKKWTRTGSLNMLVDITSATSCGRSWENTNNFKISLNSNHIDLVKFGPNDQDGYLKVQMVLDDMAQDARQIVATRSNASREEQDAFLDSLTFSEMGNRADQIIRPLDTTCQWIWRDESHKFSEWLVDPAHKSPVFVIEGNPGSGKSTLVKHILERRQQSAAQNNEFVIGFFFTERGSPIERKSDALFRTCLHQILHRYRAGFRTVIDIYRKKKIVSQGLGVGTISWDTATLRKMFCDIVIAICQDTDDTIFQRLLFIIDGLDECDSSFSHFKEAVESLLQDTVPSNCYVKFCFASRPNTRIAFLEEYQRLTLQTRNCEDIITYVHKTAARALRQTPGFSVLTDEVISKADGIMLWVELVLKELLDGKDDGSNVEELQKVLETIPTGLKELFERMLERIEFKYVEETKTLLRTVLFARRTLTVEELRRIMAFGMERFSQLSDYRTSKRVAHDNLVYKRRLQSRGGGLLEIMTKASSDYSIATVQFVHQAAKDFVENESDFLKPSISESALSIGNQFLLQSCLRYLSLPEFGDSLDDMYSMTKSNEGAALDSWDLDDIHPFLKYATLFWKDHWRETLLSPVYNASLIEEETNFIDIGLRNWIRIHSVFSSEAPQHSEDTTLLSIAAEMGLISFLGSALRSVNVNRPSGRYGFLLQAAAAHGHENAVQLLLGNGAEINACGGYHGNALVAAASSGHDRVVECLLEHHAALTASPGIKKTALKAAIESGHIKTIAGLLEAGAYNAESEEDKMAILNTQAVKEDWPVVELLLSHGADVNLMLPKSKIEESDKPPTSLTLLHTAVEQRCSPVVLKMLLGKGADASLKDTNGQTALRCALHLHHTEALKVLITTVQHVEELTSDDDWNTMHCLSARGEKDSVDLALSLHPNLTEKTKEGWTALHIAAESKNLSTLTKIIEQDCALNEPNGEGWSALHLAVNKDFRSGVKALLENGADVNATTAKMWTALHMAAHHNFSEIVLMLVEHKADVNRVTEDGYSALHLAAQNLEVTKRHHRDTEYVSPRRDGGSADNYLYSRRNRSYGQNTYSSSYSHFTSMPTVSKSIRYQSSVTSSYSQKYGAGRYGYSGNYPATPSASTGCHATMASAYSGRHSTNLLPYTRYNEITQYPRATTLDYDSRRRSLAYGRSLSPPRHSTEAMNPSQNDSSSTSTPKSTTVNPNIVELLVNAGARINDRSPGGWTLLHFASKVGASDIISLAIKKNADVNLATPDLWTPLHLAVHHKRLAAIKELLRAGSRLDLKTDKGLTVLHLAVNTEDESLVEILLAPQLERNSQPSYVNEVANGGYSALHLAAEMMQTGMVYFLLRNGADEQLQDNDGKTALQLAPLGNEEVHFLLTVANAGFIKNLKSRPKTETVLHMASRKGHLRVIELLIKEKVEVNVLDDVKRTPLHAAVEGQQIRAVRFLLKKSADVSASDASGSWPLHLAAACGQGEIGSVLLRKQAPIEAVDAEGKTALHEACKCGNFDMTRILLDRSAKVDAVDFSGSTALHWAARGGHEKVFGILLKHKAGLEVQNSVGQTPLHEACKYGHHAMARLCLDNSANIDVMDSNGYSALHWAAENGHEKALNLLLRCKARVEAQNHAGQTALQLAMKWKHDGILRLLLAVDAHLPAMSEDGIADPLVDGAKTDENPDEDLLNKNPELKSDGIGEKVHEIVVERYENEIVMLTEQAEGTQLLPASDERENEEMVDNFDGSTAMMEDVG